VPDLTHPSLNRKAWIVTGPTSGIGRRAALDLAARGTVVLVGRDPDKLAAVRAEIESKGGAAATVVADLSDIVSVRRAAAEIVALDLPLAGLLNNAGVMAMKPFTSAQGWDGVFATDHLGPLAFTEALIPALPDGAAVVFVCSAVEDPERRIARRSGFRGARFISAAASARGEWEPGGSKMAGADAYATAKQGNLAAVFSLAREYPRLRFRGVEPGVNPGSNLGRDAPAPIRALSKGLAPALSLLPHFSTPRRAARVIVAILTDPSEATGTYYDENGRPMAASKQVTDPAYSDRYIAESRELLATVGG